MKHTELVVRSWLGALAWVAGAIIVGAMAGTLCRYAWGPDRWGFTTYAQYVAIACFLWATFGHPGWEIQTFKNNTPAEVLNDRIYNTLHLLGTTLLAFSLSWPRPGVWG